ncbi:hypothetical protein BDQ12DRAFT_699684 [Crucibulum laeve]|uniref:Uncharacterized protein n=1 Tax=Crucibulum laeve TaxID=68775 RepID=A0A5C3LTE9_9AGAR|nr:hypothetical protein BDQ12DRAFT_699684 [Crucibulum laeve]
MDSSIHTESPASASRKRPRENETEAQRIKREKAAERQRRKREKDRNAAGMGIMNFPPPDHQDHQQQQHQQQQQQHAQQILQQQQQHQQEIPPSPGGYSLQQQALTPEEEARRDRVRAAARDRQRKHRALVKQKKMRELGLDMGNEVMQGQAMEDMQMHYRMGEGQPYQMPPHELAQLAHHAQLAAAPQDGSYTLPPGQLTPPQTFASTLLLSFSCAPLLKAHLLRTLNMTNEELASLEPIIADAWERWDNQHGNPHPHPYPPPPPNGPGPIDPNQGNEFRARFARSLVAPPPFQQFTTEQAGATTSTPTSGTGSGQGPPPAEAIDPHLGTAVVTRERVVGDCGVRLKAVPAGSAISNHSPTGDPLLG